jgi:tRNA (guanosine-2'-O-)-methyltransferase
MRGYFGIGIYKTKEKENVGTLWRSADNFGASFIFTIAKRYQKQPSDTGKAFKHLPLFQYDSFKDLAIPKDCKLVGIEQTEKAKLINNYKHPERAIYILGAEDEGLPDEILKKCDDIIYIDTPRCLNVATAGSIVLFHRHYER